MSLEQVEVACVRLPGRVKHVAGNGNGTHRGVEQDVRGHPDEREPWHSGPNALPQNRRPQQRARRITNARNQSEDRIQTDPDLRARNANALIQPPGKSPYTGQSIRCRGDFWLSRNSHWARVKVEDEASGLDLSPHAESAYAAAQDYAVLIR